MSICINGNSAVLVGVLMSTKTFEKVWHYLIKMNRGILYNPGIPLLDIYPSNSSPCSSGYIQENIHRSIVNNGTYISKGSPEKRNQQGMEGEREREKDEIYLRNWLRSLWRLGESKI